MKEHERAEIQEFIFQAVQAGKSETSGLVSHLEKKIDSAVGLAVEKYVNGHLRDIKAHLGEQDIKIDKLITDTTPVVQDRETISRAGKFILWLGGIAITVLTILKLAK